jgi:hypothetical protein
MPEQYRLTHYQDDVPHLPSRVPIPYHHQTTEIYEDLDGSLRQCDNSGEDPTCADQWATYQCDAGWHMWYLGGYMHCGCTVPVGDTPAYCPEWVVA